MRAPRTGRAGELEGSARIISGHESCPLACISHHMGGELTERSGRVLGTRCGLCFQVVTRKRWAKAFAEGRT
jgi:hypothetical protein